MNIAAHTPGPWAYDAETGEIFRDDKDVSPMIAVVCYDNTEPEQAHADGVLIAESPAMLEALRWALGLAEEAIIIREGDDEDDEPETTASHRAELVKAYTILARIDSGGQSDG